MFKQTSEGIILLIKVIPNAHKSALAGIENGELKIRLAAQPEKGEANEELVRFLSKLLKISKSQIVLVSGTSSRHKRVRISGLSLDKIESFLLLSGL